MRNKFGAISVITILLNAGCAANFDAKVGKIASENGVLILHSPGDLQTTMVKTENNTRSCTETDTDFSQTSSSGFTIGLGAQGTNESFGDESGKGAVTLGGRDPAVLITRELMFRACEFITNINADKRLALKVYAGTLDAVIRIAKYQALTGTQSIVAKPQSVDMNPIGNKDAPEADNSQKKNNIDDSDDSFDWSFDFDYSEDDDDIDDSHP